MMKTNDIKVIYPIFGKVHIKNLKCDGHLEAIRITEVGIKYLVRYIDNREVKINLFSENELKRVKNNEKIK